MRGRLWITKGFGYSRIADNVIRSFLSFEWDRVEENLGHIIIFAGNKVLRFGTICSYRAGAGEVEIEGRTVIGWTDSRPSYITLWLFFKELSAYRKAEEERKLANLAVLLKKGL